MIGAVALVAVAQEHFRQSHSGSQNAVYGEDGGLLEGLGVRSDNGGLVGLSLTYALPIVGELCATPPMGAWYAETMRRLLCSEKCRVKFISCGGLGFVVRLHYLG